ncbi:MAG TPA: hypothetical protein ENN07_05525 [candidate division Zixibacteria bacterium]|nr:hypothetical protein [candidate division Zixibacteria bacterium]
MNNIEIYLSILLLLCLGGLFFFSSKRKSRAGIMQIERSQKDYLQFLSFLVLGAGTGDTAKELCKIRQIWEMAETPADMFAALQLSDALSSLALDDASGRLDTDCLREVGRTLRSKRNHLLWAIVRFSGAEKIPSRKKENDYLSSDAVEKAKRHMGIRYCHYVKSYPRAWEDG